ncbi:MAG: PD-(D/E)XK nuclease family protein [Acidimicrobiales bacterium]
MSQLHVIVEVMPSQVVLARGELTESHAGEGGGGDVLAALRGDATRRAVVDPGFAGGLREWLEDGLCDLEADPERPCIVTKQVLRDALDGRAPGPADAAVTKPLALGAMVDALFRQLVTTGRIDDPTGEGLDALRADDRRSEIVDFVCGLSGPDGAAFEDELETQCAIMVSRWPRLSPAWLPRTQERIAIPLGGGSIVLIGIIDLIVGAPSAGRASVGLVEVKSGRPRPEDRDDLHFYALLETLRSGAPPFRLATFYTRSGQVSTEDVGDELLIDAVRRVLTGIGKIGAA